MNKKIIGILILCLSILPIISARQQIENTTFTIDIYNNTLEIRSSEYSGNNRNFSFSISNITNSDNSTYLAVARQSISYNFLFVRNITVEIGLVDQYTECLNNINSNLTVFNNNLTNCLIVGQQKDTTITGLNTQITTLNEKQKETENQKVLFFILGAALSAVGVLFLTGNIKRKGAKNPQDSFSPTRSR